MNQANTIDSLVQGILKEELAINTNLTKLDPKLHRLILWVNKSPENETSYTLRLGSQRFTSLTTQDKQGQTYWRFQEAGEYTDGKQLINE